jgi:type II secretory pathway component GspD/PulD (secretin)
MSMKVKMSKVNRSNNQSRPAAARQRIASERGGSAGRRRPPAPMAAAVLAIAALLFPPVLSAQKIKEMQFTNQPITDILLALGEISGKSIIPDETVAGSASYYFAETDFETALQVFLQTYKMYHVRDNNIYYVSRIHAEYEAAGQVISMDAEDVNVQFLVRAASKAMGKTILFDPLPSQALTIHVSRIAPDKLLDIITKRFPEYKVEADEDYFYIRKVPVVPETPAARAAPIGRGAGIVKKGELYSIDLEKARFQEVLDELFKKAGVEYSLMARKDAILENLRFADKSFEQLLRIVLEQTGADFTRVGDIYYIFEIQQRDILKKLVSTVRIPLRYVSAKDLVNLFPANLLSANLFKLDTGANAIILSGSVEEIGPAQAFIRDIDRPIEGRQYYRFDLSYLSPAKLVPLLQPSFRHVEPIVIPDTGSFLAALSADGRTELEEFLRLVDRPEEAVAVQLKYIKAEELLKKLPPSLAKENIIETSDPKTIFVRASASKLADFHRDLRVLDRPVPQLRYDVLVVQYQEGESLNASADFAASLLEDGDQTAFIGNMGKLLALNFDIVSNFGYQFALRLNLDLSTNRARVLADTTLLGLSDQEISFQNTETFRFREIEVDEDGNTKYTGVTREITAGLIFNLRGWISGDGMITMVTKATVSKRGVDTSQVAGTLPPTSENVISTQVRTPSGQPIVISGIIRQERGRQVSKVPLLGDIPLLGWLFRSQKETIDNTELVIYIVPRLDYGEMEPADPGLRLERLYQKFAGAWTP